MKNINTTSATAALAPKPSTTVILTVDRNYTPDLIDRRFSVRKIAPQRSKSPRTGFKVTERGPRGTIYEGYNIRSHYTIVTTREVANQIAQLIEKANTQDNEDYGRTFLEMEISEILHAHLN